ncbi:MAG: hypothetical protein LQ349_002111 [Xanthoria aureola]|nr:MAG: hypothetical protein LQ349_002111 [Xanthoria aureola]
MIPPQPYLPTSLSITTRKTPLVEQFRCLADVQGGWRCTSKPKDLAKFNASQGFEENIKAFLCGTHKHWFERQPETIAVRFKQDSCRLAGLLAKEKSESTIEPKWKSDALYNYLKAPVADHVTSGSTPLEQSLPLAPRATGVRIAAGLREADVLPFRYDSVPSRGKAESTPASPRSQASDPWLKNLHIKQGSAAMAFRQFHTISQKYWYAQGIADGRRELFEDMRLQNPDKKIPAAAYSRFENLYQQMESLISSFDDLN